MVSDIMSPMSSEFVSAQFLVCALENLVRVQVAQVKMLDTKASQCYCVNTTNLNFPF